MEVIMVSKEVNVYISMFFIVFPGSGAALGSDDWGTWSLHNDGGASSYDFLANVDSSNGNLPVMVNPKSIIPNRIPSPVTKTSPQVRKNRFYSKILNPLPWKKEPSR